MKNAPGLEYRCRFEADENRRVYLLVQKVDESAVVRWTVYTELAKYYNISVPLLKRVDHRFYSDILDVALKDWLYMDKSRYNALTAVLLGRETCRQCAGKGYIMLLNFWTECDICNDVEQGGRYTSIEVESKIRERNVESS
jgi:hypothetical protein